MAKPQSVTITPAVEEGVLRWAISEPPPKAPRDETTTWWVRIAFDTGLVANRQTGQIGSFNFGQVPEAAGTKGGTIKLFTSQQVARGDISKPVDEAEFSVS